MTDMITSKQTRLSHLTDGDTFKFRAGVRVFYKYNGNFIEFEPSEIEYIVVKKNPKSVKCMATGGRVDFLFQFAGQLHSNKTPIDTEIIICEK